VRGAGPRDLEGRLRPRIESQRHAVEAELELGRGLAGEAVPGEPRGARAARGGALEHDVHLRLRPRQVDPLLRAGHLAAFRGEAARFQAMRQQRRPEVDRGAPGCMLEPGDAAAVERQLDRGHPGARVDRDRLRAGDQAEEQGQEGDLHGRSPWAASRAWFSFYYNS
jgi:hypothetical protein